MSIHIQMRSIPYTIDDKDLVISENEKELYFSYVLQLCHVIKYFGAFIDSHPDKEANKGMKKVVAVPTSTNNTLTNSPVGQRDLVQMGETGPYILNCRLAPCFEKYVGSYAIITEINPNNGKDADAYPYYAKVKIEK